MRRHVIAHAIKVKRPP